MDELLKPIKSVLPSGLQIITVRTGNPGLLAGSVRVGAGAIHAAKINPRWEGLSHFCEHLRAVGASRNYAADEIDKILTAQLHFNHNAITNNFEGHYFSKFGANNSVIGQVFPTRNFWHAFEAIADGTFFPKFDAPTMERERTRILSEIKQGITALDLDNAKFRAQLYGADYHLYQNLGSADQVRSYSAEDCFAFDRHTYCLENVTVSIAGDIDHTEAVDRVQEILKGVPDKGSPLPVLEQQSVQSGEFRRHIDGANEGVIETALYFPAPNYKSAAFTANCIVAEGLTKIVSEKVFEKFGLYSAHFGYGLWLSECAFKCIKITTTEKDIAADALAYAVELVQNLETHTQIIDRHKNILDRLANYLEIEQLPVENWATYLIKVNSIGAPLLSPKEQVEITKKAIPEEVRQVLEELRTAPAFLDVRAHTDSLDVIPSIAVIDGWRSAPKAPGSPVKPPRVSAPHPR